MGRLAVRAQLRRLPQSNEDRERNWIMPPLFRRLLPGAVFGLVTLFTLCGALPARAIGRRLDLATMTREAGSIVAGRIVDLHEGRHPKYQNIRVLYVTVQVNQMVKGDTTDRFTFMQFGGRAGLAQGKKSLSMAQSLPDLPAYRVGQEVVLFLYPPSNAGFTSPVGGGQGMFEIRRQPGQPTTVVSEGGNGSLTVDRPLPAGLKQDQQNLLRHPGSALNYQTFLGTVKSLAKGGK
jgi:hypothetical protein